jgi:hypothetical protein
MKELNTLDTNRELMYKALEKMFLTQMDRELTLHIFVAMSEEDGR